MITMLLFITNYGTCSAISLKCAYAMGSYDIIGHMYDCEARILVGGEIDNVTNVYGTHQNGRVHENVLGLTIESQNMLFFTTNVENHFPNIIAMNFGYNSLSHISNQHLRPFPELRYLSVINNKITSLESDLFSGLNSLKLIRFTNNHIKQIERNFLDSFVLPNFSDGAGEMCFKSNVCVDITVTAEEDIVNLRKSLEENCEPELQIEM